MKVKLVFFVINITLSFHILEVNYINGNERPFVIFSDRVVIILIILIPGEFNLIVEDNKIATGFSKINLSMDFNILDFG